MNSKSVTFSPFNVIEELLINSRASLLLEHTSPSTNKSTIFLSESISNGVNPPKAISTSSAVKSLISPLNNASDILTASL